MGASKFPNDQNSKLVDENGLPIDATNPLDVKLSNNTFKLVDPINPLNAAYVDTSGNLQVEVNNGVKITDGTNTVGVTDLGGTLGKCLNVVPPNGGNAAFPTYVSANISNSVKIDQVTAGANNIRIVDKTNTSHVATVSNNGSVHTVITNNNASAVPTTITNTPSVTLSGTANVNVTNIPANAIPTTITNNPTVFAQISTTQNGVKITDGTDTVGITDIDGKKRLNVVPPNGANPVSPTYVSAVVTSMPTGGTPFAPTYVTFSADPRILNQVRISGTAWIDDRRADRYQQAEWNGLPNGSGFAIYNAQLGIYKIRPTQIMISVTSSGTYAFVFDDGSGGTTLFLKVRLTSFTPHTLTFSNGILSPYTGGTVRVFNNTGGNSDVNTTVQAWEE